MSARRPPAERASEAVSPAVIADTEHYSGTVADGADAGIHVGRAVRTGQGVGPNVVIPIAHERLSFVASYMGFPIRARAQMAAGHVAVVYVAENPGASRWAGIPLLAGTLLVYGPETQHLGVNDTGLKVAFATTRLDHLTETAEQLGVELPAPRPGAVQEFRPARPADAIGDSMSLLMAAAQHGGDRERAVDEVLRAFVNLLGAQPEGRSIGNGTGLDSRSIVRSCVEYVNGTERIPSIAELCLVAHVSERRLRQAFVDEFDEPPSRFFRSWALDEAHRRLRAADPGDVSVTDVAFSLGIDHLGRFAAYYKRIHGEPPSATLRASRSIAPSVPSSEIGSLAALR